ncbi:hypothetical protein [Jhaorihella thermophila]
MTITSRQRDAPAFDFRPNPHAAHDGQTRKNRPFDPILEVV